MWLLALGNLRDTRGSFLKNGKCSPVVTKLNSHSFTKCFHQLLDDASQKAGMLDSCLQA